MAGTTTDLPLAFVSRGNVGWRITHAPITRRSPCLSIVRLIPRLNGAFEAILLGLVELGAPRELAVGAGRVSVPVVVLFGFLRGEHHLEAVPLADLFAKALPIPLVVVGTAFGGAGEVRRDVGRGKTRTLRKGCQTAIFLFLALSVAGRSW